MFNRLQQIGAALQRIGLPGAAAAIPLLIKALDDEDEQFRSAAMDALGAFGPDAAAAVPALAAVCLT
jgi:HEAT repeat protein